MKAAVVLTLVTGCLGTPSRPAEGTTDAKSDGGPDAAGAAPFCPHPGTWGTPRVLDELQAQENQFHPYISPDGLDLWLTEPDAFLLAHRTDRTVMFQPAVAVPIDPMFSSAKGAHFSDDQQRVWFFECCEYAGPDYTYDLFFAQRLGPMQFAAGQHLTLIDMPGKEEYDAALTSDELTMVLVLGDGGNDQLYITTRATKSDEFARPTTPLSLGTHGVGATSPWLSGDGNVLYWTWNDTIWWATRADTMSPWITQGEVTLADGRTGRSQPALTRDGAILVYSADPATSGGQQQLFMAERSCL